MEIKKKAFTLRMLDSLERVGNKLPNPATLFLLLTFLVMLISALCSFAGVSGTYKSIDLASGEMTEKTLYMVNLLSADGLRYLSTHVVSSFTNFFALGTVFTIILGVGVADKSGFLAALLKKLAISTPKKYVTPVLVFLAVMSSIASSTGYVVLVPLGAILFMAFGRHPIAGLSAAFAGVSGGWGANLLIGANDPMFAGMSTQAAQIIDPNYFVSPVCNWYIGIASTILITVLGTWVTDKIIEPRLGKYLPEKIESVDGTSLNEERGMLFAKISILIYLFIILVLVLPKNGILRNPLTHSILLSPFMTGIIFFMMLFFLIPGIFYGIGAGTIKSDKDAVAMMNEAISALAPFMVLIFFAAQFTTAFTYSNLGMILSVKGAQFFEHIGFVGIPLIIAFILLCAFLNLFIAIDSAKWAMMAPIFVPMFMQLALSPEFTQMAYRIGDSCTNIITPMMPFFVLTVSLFQKYDKKAGMGTVVSTMLPYSLVFLVGWTILLLAWFLLGLPLGPGAISTYGI